jgi:hypothetical protein
MQRSQQRQRIINLLTTGLECSFYVSPRSPGLTYDELLEFGRYFGLQGGEISDAMAQVSTTYIGQTKILPNPLRVLSWIAPHIVQTPEYINPAAFDFWSASLHESATRNGVALARVDRDTTIERAAGQKITKHDMEVALAVQCVKEHFTDTDGVVSFAPGKASWPSIAEQRKGHGSSAKHDNDRERAYLTVKDIIERRTDGRAAHAESLDAFTDKLNKIGYGHFRLWWTQIVSQMRQADPEATPVARLILAAALVEGCLTFVVRHGRGLGVGVFGSKTFEEDPKRWRIEDLVNGAAAGQKDAILDSREKQRVEALIAARQRIHAGRMLSDFPGGVPDLRPEEAREAKGIADMVARRVLDWLERHPGAA